MGKLDLGSEHNKVYTQQGTFFRVRSPHVSYPFTSKHLPLKTKNWSLQQTDLIGTTTSKQKIMFHLELGNVFILKIRSIVMASRPIHGIF